MVLYRYVSIRLKDRKWDVVSADTGLVVRNVTYDDASADFPTERVRTAPDTFLGVLEWCQENEGRWWLDSLGQPISAFRKHKDTACISIWYANGYRTAFQGDATFASLAALKNFLEMEPEIEQQIITSAVGTKQVRNPGAKEVFQKKVRFPVAAVKIKSTPFSVCAFCDSNFLL